MSNSLSNIRAALMDMVPGMITELDIAPITIDEFRTWFNGYKEVATRRYRWRPSKIGKIGIEVHCVFAEKTTSKYGLEKIAIGQSAFIEMPSSGTHRLRQSASWLKRKCGMNFRVMQENGGVRVTRLANDEIVDGVIQKAERPSFCKFPLDWLIVGEDTFISAENEPLIANLRAYCNYHGKKLDMRFRVTAHIDAEEGPGHRITRTA